MYSSSKSKNRKLRPTYYAAGMYGFGKKKYWPMPFFYSSFYNWKNIVKYI